MVERGGSGLSETDWAFIRPFDKPLLSSFPDTASHDDVRRHIEIELRQDYAPAKPLIAERFPDLTEAETLITFLTLRSALSLPVLDSGKRLQGKLEPMLMDPSGNCLHHGLRSAYLMDAFGLTARLVTLSTPPHIMGHAVADVYDPLSRTAALVDSNKKFAFFLRDVDASFFETVLPVRDVDERKALLERMIMVELPADVRYFNPSDGHLSIWRSGNGAPVSLQHVREDMADERIAETRDAFLDGYERLFTERTRDGKHWWLRVHDIATWADGHKTGLQGRDVVDNRRIERIIADIRRDLGVLPEQTTSLLQ